MDMARRVDPTRVVTEKAALLAGTPLHGTGM